MEKYTESLIYLTNYLKITTKKEMDNWVNLKSMPRISLDVIKYFVERCYYSCSLCTFFSFDFGIKHEPIQADGKVRYGFITISNVLF